MIIYEVNTFRRKAAYGFNSDSAQMHSSFTLNISFFFKANMAAMQHKTYLNTLDCRTLQDLVPKNKISVSAL